MDNPFKQGSGFILLGFLCFTLGSRDIEVVTAKEFNTTKDVYVKIWNNNIPINSNGLMFVRVGTRNLQINCSVPSDYEKPVNIGWRKGLNWLDGRSVEFLRSNNNTITLRLTIDHTPLNGSIFWCGPRDVNIFETNVKGSQVTIIAGDLPEPPIDITHSIVDLRLYIINIKWRAPSNVGTLPAYYNVTYIPCNNKTYCQRTLRHQFCTIPHVIGKVDYKCSKLREEMKSLESMRGLYKVTIATVNPFGENKSPEFYVDVDLGGIGNAFLPTPLPPLSLKVFSRVDSTIIIQWTPRKLWVLANVKYKILYHKDKDHTNKTIVLTNGQTSLTLSENNGIEAYTKYYFYITVEFTKDSNGSYNSSGVSEPLGPRIIRTPEGEPAQGPDIFNISSSRYPYDTTMRNITITWTVPPLSKWRGKPSHIKICYKKGNSQEFSEKCISTTPYSWSQAVLTGLDSMASYIVYLKLCNSKTCGSPGERKEIEPIGPNETGKTDFTKNSETLYVLLVVAAVFVLLIFTVLVYYFFFMRKPKTTGNQLSLQENIGDLGSDVYVRRYVDVEQLSLSEGYDVPNQ